MSVLAAIDQTHPTPQISVVSLVRVSTAEQGAEGRGGLDRQRDVIRRTIAAKNLHCIASYELIGVSGTITGADPVVRKILGRILSGEVQGLVCADLDRLFRPDNPESFGILQVFKDSGALIYAGGDTYDLSSGSGLLFSSIRGAIAGYELSLMKERQQGAKEAKRRAGKCPTNALTLPLGVGYDRQSEAFFYTPEITRVRELFFAFDAGNHNYSDLGRKFGLGSASVRVLLRNPIYTGWREITSKRGPKRISKNGKAYRIKVARPAEEVIRCKVLDGVISEELFQRVQREMLQTKFNFIERHRSGDRINLNAGIGYCACCGETLQIVSGKRTTEGRTPGAYVCKANHYLYKARLGGCRQCHIRSDEFDQATAELATSILSDPSRLAALLHHSYSEHERSVIPFPNPKLPSELEAQLLKRDARLLDAYEQGAISVDELKTKRESIRKERQSLADTSAPKPPSEDIFIRQARLIVKAAVLFRDVNDLRQKKSIIQSIFRAIYVRGKYIIGFKFREVALQDTGSSGSAGGDQIVTLPSPLPIGRPPPPEGTRRCLDCDQFKPTEMFYRNLNRCHPCRKIDANRRYVKRREARKPT